MSTAIMGLTMLSGAVQGFSPQLLQKNEFFSVDGGLLMAGQVSSDCQVSVIADLQTGMISALVRREGKEFLYRNISYLNEL